jgi:hypothetical protein
MPIGAYILIMYVLDLKSLVLHDRASEPDQHGRSYRVSYLTISSPTSTLPCVTLLLRAVLAHPACNVRFSSEDAENQIISEPCKLTCSGPAMIES